MAGDAQAEKEDLYGLSLLRAVCYGTFNDFHERSLHISTDGLLWSKWNSNFMVLFLPGTWLIYTPGSHYNINQFELFKM